MGLDQLRFDAMHRTASLRAVAGRPSNQLSTNLVQPTIIKCEDDQLMSGALGAPPVLWHSTHAVQPTIPKDDYGQLMSGACDAEPIQWLSTNAVQRSVPLGDDDQLMFGLLCSAYPRA